MLTHSFENLAQSFRIMLESDWHYKRLLNVDRAEAIGNLEFGINSQLNAFHSLYDQMLEFKIELDWYSQPELVTILVIRNARHHNKANRIRTLANFHRHNVTPPTNLRNYFYVDTLNSNDDGDFFDIPISWYDIDHMLSLPKNESRLRPEVKNRVRNYLNADDFEREAYAKGFSKEDIFFNYVPLSHNAGVILHPYIKDYVTPSEDSVEANYFFKHFEIIEKADTSQLKYKTISFKLPI